MIISIKSSAKGGSSRGLVHYLAHSKLDQTKEETEKREFFNETENDLDVRLANQKLSISGGKPRVEELLHIVIAPSKEEIERVGDDLKTRKASLKTIVRDTVAELEKEVKAKHLKWIAVVHFNTDNPHTHLALQKEFVNESGQLETLRITRQMLHYNENGENGEKILHKGSLILAAEKKLKEIAIEREEMRENVFNTEAEKSTGKAKSDDINSPQISVTNSNKSATYSERRILAAEMLVASEIARRSRNIENLIEHGDKKRFKIKTEETGTTRHVSLFDIERKIEIISRRKARQLHPKNAEKRAAATSLIAETERAKHLPVINQLETIRRHVLGFENRHLHEAEEKHTQLNNQKLLIEKKYQYLKIDAPLPLFTPDELQQLQTEAIGEQNIEKILLLENIRQSNATDLNQPTRRGRDVQELLGAKIVASLKLEAAEKRLANFPQTKDFVKVKIGNSFWSHNSLQNHKNQNPPPNGLWKQFKANTFGLVFSSEKKNSSDKNIDYQALKKQISDALENLENTRRIEIEKQREFVQTLDEIFEAETNTNKNNFMPSFSAFELAEVEDLAQSAGRFDLYEKSLHWQENFLQEKLARTQTKSPDKNQKNSIQKELPQNQSGRNEKIIGKFVLGRAAARSLIANTKIAEAEENIARYNRNKIFIKHRIKDDKTGAEREVSLRDIEPKEPYYLLDKFFLRAFESKEQKRERRLVYQAANNKVKELKSDLEDSQQRLSRLETQKNLLQTKYEIPKKITPVFTPKEIAALDARKYQTTEKHEAEHLAKIISEAEKNNGVERIQYLLKNAAKELEINIPHLSNEREPKISPLNEKIFVSQTNDKFQEFASPNSATEKNTPPVQNQISNETIERNKTISREKGRSR